MVLPDCDRRRDCVRLGYYLLGHGNLLGSIGNADDILVVDELIEIMTDILVGVLAIIPKVDGHGDLRVVLVSRRELPALPIRIF